MSEAISDWKKGGLRYAKLQELVPAFFSPARVSVFFVAVKGWGGKTRLFNPLTPFQREYVIALTAEEIAVLKLRRPGVFRASIAGTVYRAPRGQVDVKWRNGKFTVGGRTYQPIAFHHEDAERVVRNYLADSSFSQAGRP